MSQEFHPGDVVSWNTSQGSTKGKVIKRLTEERHIEGHKVAASKDNPEYLVETLESEQRAAHKPDALTMVEKAG